MSNQIKISHSTGFYLFVLPKIRLIKAKFKDTEKQYFCEIEDKLVLNNLVFFIEFKNKRFNKLSFKKYPIHKPKSKIKYPNVFSVFSMPKLSIPINIYAKPSAIKTIPNQLNNIETIQVNQNPIDLSISQNLIICQTHLNQQLQLCQVLNQ